MTNADEPPTRRRRLQFSLRTALLLIVAVALGLSVWVSSRQWQQTQGFQAEIKRLRGEVGDLTIEEGQEDKVHAIAVPTQEAMTWKWRVYVPSGGTYYIKATTGKIPEMGEPKGAKMSSTFAPGERVVTLALRKDNQGKWEWLINDDSSTLRFGVLPDAVKQIEAGYLTACLTVGEQKVVDPGVDLQLMRLRMVPGLGSEGSQTFEGPGPGILLRISETPP